VEHCRGGGANTVAQFEENLQKPSNTLGFRNLMKIFKTSSNLFAVRQVSSKDTNFLIKAVLVTQMSVEG
jgi:hypothetical protein